MKKEIVLLFLFSLMCQLPSDVYACDTDQNNGQDDVKKIRSECSDRGVKPGSKASGACVRKGNRDLTSSDVNQENELHSSQQPEKSIKEGEPQ